MARRWPANPDGTHRDDDRPPLAATKGSDMVAWQAVYAVGRADRGWLETATEPSDLSQAAVVKRVDVTALAAVPEPSLETDQLFDVIYADPPWSYGNKHPQGRPDNHYPTMDLDDICALPVPAARDCVLYLWATAPLLPEALQVMGAWGFTYRTGAVWDKESVGVGYWFRGQHEHLLVGVKGQMSPPDRRMRVSSVYREPRREHSRKPDIVREQIAAWFPHACRLEMFSRRPVPGWVNWGNQVDSSLADLPVDAWDPHDPAVTGQHELWGAEA